VSGESGESPSRCLATSASPNLESPNLQSEILMFGPTELIVILMIVLLFFGATKVPQLARSLGQGMREFREGAKSAEAEETLREESA